jgi:hypothetical protein
MTPADLDELERQYASDDLHDAADMHFALIVHAPDLIRLARRGLRAERETCGTCDFWADGYCSWWDDSRLRNGYCHRWREWEGDK